MLSHKMEIYYHHSSAHKQFHSCKFTNKMPILNLLNTSNKYTITLLISFKKNSYKQNGVLKQVVTCPSVKQKF